MILTPSIDPERDDAAAALQIDPVEHQHRQPQTSSGRLISSIRFSRVRDTNSRLTADFDVDLQTSSISDPTGSPVRA
jgi:hypothetical protein